MFQPRLNHRFMALWIAVIALALLLITLPVQAQGNRVAQGVAFLQANNIPPQAYVELSATIGNPQEAAKVLIKYGYTPEQAQAFMTPQNVLTMAGVLNPSPANEILIQAIGILAPYNLSMNDLTALMPNLTNPQAMVATLMQKGLTQEQATQLLTQAAPLIQQASDGGMLQYALLNDQVAGMFSQAGLSHMMMYEMGNIINDPAAIAAYMQQKGYTDAQIQTFQGLAAGITAQGITPELLEGWTVKNMVYRLEGIGLDPTTIREVVALGNVDAVREYLMAQGFSGDMLELALTNIQGTLGENGEVLTPERLDNFQAWEAANLFREAGVDPADLGNILAMKGDPEAMSNYLAETYGLTDDQIAAFEKGLNNSTFGQTVDPENADDFSMNVEDAVQAQETGTDDQVGTDQGSGSGETGSNDSGGNDNSGGSDSGGDSDSGSGDSGGGDGGDSGGDGGDSGGDSGG